MAKKRTLVDRILNSIGYIKQRQVSVTSAAAFELPSRPPSKTSEYLKNYAQWVYSCVKARSNAVSKIKIRLFKAVDRKTGEVEEVTEHEVLALLKRANPWMTFKQLVKATQIYKDLAGEAFWLLVKGGENSDGKISMIWPLRPDYFEIKTDKDKFITGYTYKIPGHDPIDFRSDEIIHFKEFNPIDPYRGMSIVRAAALSIDTDRFAKEYNRRFFDNSAVPSVVLKTDQTLNDDVIKRAKTQWQNEYGGRHKSHKMAVLDGGLELDKVSMSQADLEFLEGQRFNRDEILAMFQVPKTVLGMTEGVTVSNAEATYLVFTREVVQPEMEQFVDFLNEFLLTQKAFQQEDIFFVNDDPVPENVEEKVKVQTELVKVGAMTPNEVRNAQGLDQVEGLDRHFTLAQLVPLTTQDEEGGEKQVTSKPVKKGPRVDIPHKTLEKWITDDIKEKVKHGIIALFKKEISVSNDKNTQEPESSWSKEKQENVWKEYVQKAENFERSYKDKLISFFNRQEKDVLERARKNVKAIQQSDIDKILFSVTTENVIATEILIPIIRQFMDEAGNDTMDHLGQPELVFEMGTIEVRRFLKQEGLRGVKSMNKVTKAKLRTVLADAVKEGEGIPQVVSRIKSVFEEATTKRAEKIARTEILKAGNKATVESFKQSGVVTGKQWFTAIDERVCPMCAPLHGKVIAIDRKFFEVGETQIGSDGRQYPIKFENIEFPPRHPLCRCIPVPITINERSARPQVNMPEPEEKTQTKEKDENDAEKEIDDIYSLVVGDNEKDDGEK